LITHCGLNIKGVIVELGFIRFDFFSFFCYFFDFFNHFFDQNNNYFKKNTRREKFKNLKSNVIAKHHFLNDDTGHMLNVCCFGEKIKFCFLIEKEKTKKTKKTKKSKKINFLTKILF
jgi:hypothetical protein